MTSSSVIFFGTEAFSGPSLEALIAAGYDVKAVVTKPDSRRGRGRGLEAPLVKRIAQAHDIPVLQPNKLGEITADLEKLLPATGVLVSYGKIIPQRILDLFEPVGIINVHPSLLPKYRGPAPIEGAILAGDKVTGISIMKLTAGMDEGPVFSQTTYPLRGDETKPQLYERLSTLGAQQLIADLPAILEGSLVAKPQEISDVSYTSLISKQDGIVDPLTDDAYAIERKVRAYAGYPKVRLSYKNNDVIITSAKPSETQTGDELIVPCANNTWLRIVELIGPSGKTMSGRDFLHGLKH